MDKKVKESALSEPLAAPNNTAIYCLQLSFCPSLYRLIHYKCFAKKQLVLLKE